MSGVPAAAAVPYPVTMRRADPFSAPPIAPAGGVYVAVIVQVPFGTAGDGGVVVVTAAIPGLIAVPTAHVPPSTQAPVPVSRVSVIAVGIIGPASTLGAGPGPNPGGGGGGAPHGAARHCVDMLATVMVPVSATVLAGVVVNNGAVCVVGEVPMTAIESWPVSDTV